MRLGTLAAAAILGVAAAVAQTDSDTSDKGVIDEVVWVVGDEAILKSDVEMMRNQAQQEGTRFNGNPDCAIPEQLAVQKLFLHQAAIDSIEVTEAEVAERAEAQLNYWLQAVDGSKEKLEEYRKMSISQIRDELRDAMRDNMKMQRMREKLVADIKVTPAEVRRYFKDMPADSIPFVPTTVEVQILTQTPKIEQEEIDRVKNELRSYTDRVTKGETSFATLARLYSEDPGSARMGGEMDYVGRGMLDPAFAQVAFNLTDPKKISKIVESEFGFHIIQLVDKRGDKIKVRHILLKPKVSASSIETAKLRLDSIRTDIVNGVFSFDQGASVISDDKDTRNNYGNMTNATAEARTSKFKMDELPPEVARVVDTMQVGQISAPLDMINARGKTVCGIVKLKNRVDGHKAVITEDFQVLKDVVLQKRREQKLHDWVLEKIKSTYVRVNDKYKDCEFEYQGWIK